MGVMDEFSTRLKKLREIAELTQAQLAEKLGVSRGSISYYENKDRIPDIEFLDKVSSFFGVSFNYLMGYSENKSETNELIGHELDLTDEAIEGFRAIRGDVMSLLLENSKFAWFIRMLGKHLDFTSSNERLNQFQYGYLEYLFSKVIMLVIRELEIQKYADSFCALPSNENAIDVEEKYRLTLDEWEQTAKEMLLKTEQNLTDDEKEAHRIWQKVNNYLNDLNFQSDMVDSD